MTMVHASLHAYAAEALSSVGLDPFTQQQLQTPLPLASLHILSPSDKIVHVEQTRQLSRQFDASRRQVLQHELGQ
jgi:predicted alpha/beta hydrolase family esterase